MFTLYSKHLTIDISVDLYYLELNRSVNANDFVIASAVVKICLTAFRIHVLVDVSCDFSLQAFPETTVLEAMNEVRRLKHHYTKRKKHHSMIGYDNFASSMQPRLA